MSIQEFQPTTIPVVAPKPTYARPPMTITEAVRETPTISRDTIALALVLCAALVTHAFNMFNFPLYRQDEGIVSQQAWSFMHNWTLSPYTYTYEHPPMATFMLSVWTLLTGGFHTFGPAINSGRVLMVVLSMGSTFFLYRIARQLTGSTGGAVVTGLFFSISPLAIDYQRLVVVDNFMVFWLLASLYFTICNRGRLFYFFLASTSLGLAFVSRESALFFVPGFLILTVIYSDKMHRLFAIWGNIFIGGIITFQFFLYAIFKSELFPDNFDFANELAGKANHVSLFGTFFQNYHNVTPLWNENQGFTVTWQMWQGIDGLLLMGGLACALLNLVFGFKRKETWVAPLMGLSYGAFVVLGGVDADYMIVALLPFLALSVGQTVGWLGRVLGPIVGNGVMIGIVAALGYLYIANNQTLYTSDVNFSYGQVLSWIKGNIPSDRKLIITDALWVDLRTSYNGPAYDHAESHWKAANDPAIRVGVFKGDYKNADYLIMTEEMRKQFESKGLAFTQQALTNSSLVKQFDGPEALQIRKINNRNALLEPVVLTDGYNFFKSHFIGSDGRITDAQGKTTAAQQADAMMMALWNNDHPTFDKVWVWSAHNLQLDSNLYRSDAAVEATRADSPANSHTNTRVDIDIATALVLADRRWHEQNYVNEAQYILNAIWDNEVVVVNKHPYLKATALAAAQKDTEVLLNLGAFSPQAIKLFAEMDKTHDWNSLYDSGYALLRKASWYGRGDYKGVGLPPGFVMMNTDTEELRAVTGKYGVKLGDFDEEGQQALWRVALDYKWNQSQQAKDYIETAGWFLVKYWEKNQTLPDQFANNGLPVDGTSNLGNYAVASAYAGILDQIQLAKTPNLDRSSSEIEIVARAFMGSFYRKTDQGYWLRQDDIETQQWGWMATAYHLNQLDITFKDPKTTPQPAQGR